MDISPTFVRPTIRSEFMGSEFGDARLSARLVTLAESLSAAPDKSLPKATGTKRGVNAAYRFFGNDAVEPGAILEPHRKQTVGRIVEAKTALCIHDTSSLVFAGEREGLGPVSGSERGMLLHVSLAVSNDGARRPLGVLAANVWVRSDTPRNKNAKGQKLAGSDYAKLEDKESSRWLKQVREAEERVGDGASLIHVADREADAYAFVAELRTQDRRFVIRSCKDRVAREVDNDAWEKLRVLEQRAPTFAEREVALSRRAKTSIPGVSKTFPARDRRAAKLRISAMTVELCRPRYDHNSARTVIVNIVRVEEIGTPSDMIPVTWCLLTSEPIETTDDVLAIVDSYRARWVIEEYFKALKTGCQIEKLQLESFHALSNAIALHLPIAASILLLRNLADREPHAPAERVLSSTQIAVLRSVSDLRLAALPTVAEVMLAVAMLGGYIKHKVRPGWLVLARGMQDLLMYERGWVARESQLKM